MQTGLLAPISLTDNILLPKLHTYLPSVINTLPKNNDLSKIQTRKSSINAPQIHAQYRSVAGTHSIRPAAASTVYKTLVTTAWKDIGNRPLVLSGGKFVYLLADGWVDLMSASAARDWISLIGLGVPIYANQVDKLWKGMTNGRASRVPHALITRSYVPGNKTPYKLYTARINGA